MIEPRVNSKQNSEQFTKQQVNSEHPNSSLNSSLNSEHIPGLAELAIQQTFEQTKPKRFSWKLFTKQGVNTEQQTVNQTVNTEQTSKPKRFTLFTKHRTANQGVNSEQTTPVNTKLEAVNRTSRVHVEFASLARLETGLQWAENLIHILTPRLLVVGFVVSMVDLLTHGSLLNIPGVMLAWAIVQALAVDATLPNMWRLAWTRFDERRWIAGGILLAIGIGLGLVVFAALSIQFLQQAENISLDQTMRSLGVNPEVLTYVRSSSVVLLAAVLSVLNRTKRTAESKRVNNEPVERENSEQLQFTSKPADTQGVNSKPNKVLRLDGSKQQRIRTILEENPDITVTELAAAVGVSKGYASQQRARFNFQCK
jgi:hypothetical protein